MSDAEVTSISSKIDIFMHRTIQMAVLGPVEAVYKPLDSWSRTIWNL